VTTPSRRRVKVKLLGELGRKYGRFYEFMALNPREVISALSNQIDGFRDYLRGAHENGVFFKLVTADSEGIDYNECMMPCDTLVIAPVITGAGGSGMSIGKVLLGAVLIGLAFIPGIGTATSTAIAAGANAGFTAVGSALFGIGGALLFGGIAELLTPTPKQPKETEQSFLFDRAVDLTSQGFPIPLLYGEFLATSPLVISSAISTVTVPADPLP
jgi:predicted phage tail protein